MNAKRMQFGLIALAIYAVLGVVGAYTATPAAPDSDPGMVADSERPGQRGNAGGSGSAGDGFDVSIELHSLLPGSLK
jgi:hypothetical protein